MNTYAGNHSFGFGKSLFSFMYDFTILFFSRQVPKIRKVYTERERATMAFPINIIEEAYDENPFYFRDLNDLKTNSGNKNLMEELKETGDGQPRGDGKQPQLEQAPGGGGTAVQPVIQASKPPQLEHRVAACDGDGLKQAPAQLHVASPGSKNKSKKKSKKSKKSHKKM